MSIKRRLIHFSPDDDAVIMKCIEEASTVRAGLKVASALLNHKYSNTYIHYRGSLKEATKEEDKKLLDLFDEYQGNFDLIRRCFSYRNKSWLKTRYAFLKRRD